MSVDAEVRYRGCVVWVKEYPASTYVKLACRAHCEGAEVVTFPVMVVPGALGVAFAKEKFRKGRVVEVTARFQYWGSGVALEVTSYCCPELMGAHFFKTKSGTEVLANGVNEVRLVGCPRKGPLFVGEGKLRHMDAVFDLQREPGAGSRHPHRPAVSVRVMGREFKMPRWALMAGRFVIDGYLTLDVVGGKSIPMVRALYLKY